MTTDIVVTTCDRAALLKRTVKYLVQRTRTPYQLHILNDASREKNAALAREWERRGLVASAICRRRRAGIPANLRALLGITRSDPLVFTDDDILCPDLEPDWLARGLAAMEQYPRLGLLALNSPQCNVGRKRGKTVPGDPVTFCRNVPGSLVFARRQVLASCTPPDGVPSPVRTMCVLAASRGWRIGYLTHVYCQHIGSVSVRNRKDLSRELERVLPIDGDTLEPPEGYRS